jgi:polysaccharide chain length determinant protein (PEP-CTERM system associated)
MELGMIENRDLSMDDYLAMLRRRVKILLIPALVAPLVGFGVSFVFPPKYTSQATILVEGQKVPEGYVAPVVTEDLTQRIATMEQRVLTRGKLQPMIERLGLAKGGRSLDEVVDSIRANIDIQPVEPGVTTGSTSSTKKKSGQRNEVPGFYVNFSANNPGEAQEICAALTSMLLDENVQARTAVAENTTQFLTRQLDQAKHDLDDQDSKLAVFKRQYVGQLPGDEDSNLKILMGLNSQLDANTQTMNRAQQDKAYTESLLAQQLTTWKSSDSAANPQTLLQQLAALQSQLITLQARYTEDHPDVVKTKNDIAEIKRRLKQVDSGADENQGIAVDKTKGAEPPEIQKLRLLIHQYDEAIAQASRDQRRLQGQIQAYQGRVALTPGVEEQYKALTRDYETAQKFYNELLAKKSESEMQTNMEQEQRGELMRLLNPASLPDTPSFPVRWMFAAGGLGSGLALALGLAMWLELRDKSIRDEQDVMAALELPMLVSMPWIGSDGKARSSDGRVYGRSKPPADEEKQTVEV